MKQEILMNTKEKKQFYLQCLNDVVISDSVIEKSELEIINLLVKALEEEIPKEKVNIKLNDNEKYFILREMYRLAIIDGDFHEKENTVILKFIKDYSVDDDVHNVTKDWALGTLEIEKKYKNFIEDKLENKI